MVNKISWQVLIQKILLYSSILILVKIIPNPFSTDFDLQENLVPASEIHSGGLGKDGIPALNYPLFVRNDSAHQLKANDRILGLSINGINKAYPINILNWHEIVNDRFNNTPVVVTFCPLCNSGMAYSASIDNKKLSFGVSGMLYNSDVLLYDRETESLWSQLMNQAIAGPLQGKRLTPIPLTHTSWKDWKTRHPNTLVLSDHTGYIRDYAKNPYESYKLDRKIWFPVAHSSDAYHPKELILGIEMNGQSKAYPFSELAAMPQQFSDMMGKQIVHIRYSNEYQTASIYNFEHKKLPGVITFWFAWYAFHPKTSIFKAKTDNDVK